MPGMQAAWSQERPDAIVEDESQSPDDKHLADWQRSRLAGLLVLAHLSLCTKLCVTASMAGQLTVTGMAWEGFDMILTWGSVWFVAQAVILRLSDCGAIYDPVDVALSGSFLVPYLGDPFDSLKDAMLASVAMQSPVLLLRVFGIIGMVYLWLLHVCILLPFRSTMLELQNSYLPVLLLKPRRPGVSSNNSWMRTMWLKFCICLYKQTTASRQQAMLAEDLPQALLACAVSISAGATGFTIIATIVIPAARLTFAFFWHSSIAETVKDWLVQQAAQTLGEDRLESSNELSLAMLKLQTRLRKDVLWTRDLLQDCEQTISAKLQVESLARRAILPNWIVLQWALVAVDQEVSKEISEEALSQALGNLLSIAVGDSTMHSFIGRWNDHFGPKLERSSLQLRRLRLRPSQWSFLASSIKHWTSLTDLQLDFYGSNLGNEECRALAASISKFTKMTKLVLKLGSLEIGAEGCKALAAGIYRLTALTELTLNLDSMDPTSAFGFKYGIGSWHDIGSEGCRFLAACVSNLTEMTKLELVLSRCKIGNGGCRAIAAGIFKLTAITELTLDLDANEEISDEGCRFLAASISHLKKIFTLKLSLERCNISNEGCKAIAAGISRLTAVTKLRLDLGYNKDISSEGRDALSASVSQLCRTHGFWCGGGGGQQWEVSPGNDSD
eukprot:s4877_g2.t1